MHPPGPGRILAKRYVFERLLGVGGHGQVWLATDLKPPGPRVAVKAVANIWYPRPPEEVVRRISAEGHILANLRHPAIVSLRDIIFGRTGPYLVLEYVDGATLSREMVRRAQAGLHFEIREVVGMVRRLAGGLRAAHRRGVVHRDLKPSNVMWLDDGEVKLLDFGVAKLLATNESDATTIGRTIGSPYYMAPEQACGRSCDPRADVFALASILFEVLTLHRTWVVDPVGHRARVRDPVQSAALNDPREVLRRLRRYDRPRPSRYRPTLSSAVDRTLARALAPDPEDRHPNVRMFADDLIASLDQPGLADSTTRQLRAASTASMFRTVRDR